MFQDFKNFKVLEKGKGLKYTALGLRPLPGLGQKNDENMKINKYVFQKKKAPVATFRTQNVFSQ